VCAEGNEREALLTASFGRPQLEAARFALLAATRRSDGATLIDVGGRTIM